MVKDVPRQNKLRQNTYTKSGAKDGKPKPSTDKHNKIKTSQITKRQNKMRKNKTKGRNFRRSFSGAWEPKSSQNRAKIDEKSIKNMIDFLIRLFIDVEPILKGFWEPKSNKNRTQSDSNLTPTC